MANTDDRLEPVPDPLPSPRHSMMARFTRIMKWMALVSIAVAAIAVLLVVSGESGDHVHVHMMIATALGAGLTVLLAGALMTLAFLSSSSGHDDQAKGSRSKDDL